MRRLAPLCFFLLCGCSLIETPAQRAVRNSPDFKAGYQDGCASAGHRGADPRDSGVLRDEDAYRTNKAYHSGWGAGFNSCRTNQMNGGPIQPDRGPIPDPSPGGLP